MFIDAGRIFFEKHPSTTVDLLQWIHDLWIIYNNGNNLMTYVSKLKVDRISPGEPILYLSGKYHM